MKKFIDSLGNEVTETLVIAKICTLLNNNGYVVWRHSNTGGFDTGFVEDEMEKLFPSISMFNLKSFLAYVKAILKRGWRKAPLQILGIPDIVGFNIRTCKFVGIEIKLGTDQLSPEQLKILNLIEAAGGEGYLVRDFPVFSKWFMREKWKIQQDFLRQHTDNKQQQQKQKQPQQQRLMI